MTTTKPITPDHIFEMTGASAPSLAPDGDTLVITKQTIRREAMETISVLMISQRSVTGQFTEYIRDDLVLQDHASDQADLRFP